MTDETDHAKTKDAQGNQKKRFKLTATGKVKHRKAFPRPQAGKEGGKRNRQARIDRLVEGKQIAMIRHALLPSA